MSMTRVCRRLAPSLGLLCALAGAAPTARADEPTAPRTLQYGREQARKGVAHVQARRWGEGRQALREAVAAKETAVLVYYLALCEFGLGNLREAYEQLRRSLRLAQTGETGESAGVLRQVVEDATPLLQEVDTKLPKVVVRWSGSPPSGASVSVDGEAFSAQQADVPLRFDPGPHELVASAPGKKSYTTSFRLDERQTLEVPLALDDEAPAAVFVSPPPPRPAAVAERPRGGWQRPVGYAGLGLGAALLGAGVFSSLRVRSLEKGFDDDASLYAYRDRVPAGGDTCALARSGREASPGGGAATAAEVRGTCDEAERFETLQYVFYGAGAAFTAAGVYFAFVAPPKAPKAGAGVAWRITPGAGVSPTGLTWRLTF